MAGKHAIILGSGDEGSVQNGCAALRQVWRHQAGDRCDPAWRHRHQDFAAHRLADQSRVRPVNWCPMALTTGRRSRIRTRTLSTRSTKTTTRAAFLTKNRSLDWRRRLGWSRQRWQARGREIGAARDVHVRGGDFVGAAAVFGGQGAVDSAGRTGQACRDGAAVAALGREMGGLAEQIGLVSRRRRFACTIPTNPVMRL